MYLVIKGLGWPVPLFDEAYRLLLVLEEHTDEVSGLLPHGPGGAPCGVLSLVFVVEEEVCIPWHNSAAGKLRCCDWVIIANGQEGLS